MIIRTLSLIFATLTLCSCGTYHKDRAATGAMMGAGAGLVTGAILGTGYPILGTLAGAGLGAAIGSLTDPETINLGEPPWSSKFYEW